MPKPKAEIVLDWYSGPYYLAGQSVPAGRYSDVDTHREIFLEEADILPASLDGRVAVYVPQPDKWADVSGAH